MHHDHSRTVRSAAIMLSLSLSLLLCLSLVVSGCATVEAHPEIPGAALMGSEGNGRLTYRAPEAGTIYVYNVPDKQTIYSGRVEAGEMVTVNPNDDRITVDGRIVSEQELDDDTIRRLYFKPESRTGEQRIRIEERRIEERRIQERE